MGVHLSGENKRQLWIPEGFAHGFLTLSNTAEFLYKTTNYYAPQCEGAIRWDDPQVGIEWPIEDELSLSKKDQDALNFRSARMFN
ncbi:dTDP-4-dehydrorhamnose 3,5-epimerase family protein [Aeromonas sp. QDB59]|uniref:dTDP-4-dehydrorhamnose 3,5-epimerase family protein n=1 Tax=Aeromonas sp. QDB59 TaxID=2990497 RepID=UPI003FA47E72